LGLLTCKNRLPYNLYCVGGDVKHCLIQLWPQCMYVCHRCSMHPAYCHRWPCLPSGCSVCLEQSAGVVAITASFPQWTEDGAFCFINSAVSTVCCVFLQFIIQWSEWVSEWVRSVDVCRSHKQCTLSGEGCQCSRRCSVHCSRTWWCWDETQRIPCCKFFTPGEVLSTVWTDSTCH